MTLLKLNHLLNLYYISSLIEMIEWWLIIIIILSTLVLFSSRAGKILDTRQKILTSLAAGTIAYKNLTEGSSSENDDDQNKKDDKKDNKDIKNKPSNNNEGKK
jgi:hypothetical protein